MSGGEPVAGQSARMGLAVGAGSVGADVGGGSVGTGISTFVGTKIVGAGSDVGDSEPQASSARATRTPATMGINVRFIPVSGSRFQVSHPPRI